MDRREALKALVSLPATARVSVARLKPNDVIVIECDGPIWQMERARLADQLKDVWPDHRVVILDGKLKLKIAAG